MWNKTSAELFDSFGGAKEAQIAVPVDGPDCRGPATILLHPRN
jgi:hypothetical protein